MNVDLKNGNFYPMYGGTGKGGSERSIAAASSSATFFYVKIFCQTVHFGAIS